MARCPTCDYPVPNDRERVGARCPSCHEPLYEPPGRIARFVREGEASCTLHAGMESVGMCLRCNSYVCETCRTRWRGQVLCLGCIHRALAAGESAPAQLREPFHQALRGLLLGAAAWVLAVFALSLLGRLDAGHGGFAVVGTFVLFVVFAVSVLVATTGVGLALAALRASVGSRALALTGLIVAGGYVGLALGLGALAVWQN